MPVPECGARCKSLVQRCGLCRPEETPDQIRERMVKAEEEYKNLSPFMQWVRTTKFELLTGILIMFNTVVMVIELEYRGSVQAQDRLDSTKSNDDYETPKWRVLETILYVCEHFFCLAFLSEAVLKAMSYKWKYFTTALNWIDIIVVFSAVMDLYLAPVLEGVLPDTTLIEQLRLFRLAKVLRVVRSLTLFQPLRLLVLSIASSVGALFWSIVLLGVFCMIGAIFMTQTLHTWLMDNATDSPFAQEVFSYWGTFAKSMLTMFQITMAPGAWTGPGRRCIFEVNAAYVCFFVPYGLLVSFAVIRVISALFLKQTMAAAAVDPDQAMAERAKKKDREIAALRAIFEEGDKDGGGSVTEREFCVMLQHPRVKTILNLMEIDTADAQGLFRLLDDGDGHLYRDELCAAVARIRGNAKSSDVLTLMYLSEQMQMQLKEIQELIVKGQRGRALPVAATSP